MIVKLKIKNIISILENIKEFSTGTEKLRLVLSNKTTEIDLEDIISYTVYTDTGSIIEESIEH